MTAFLRYCSIGILLSLAMSLVAQQPQSSNPVFHVNAETVQGVGPGFWPSAGSGLTLNVGPGTAIGCSSYWHGATLNDGANTYAGGTLTLADNATNYVYWSAASSCQPAAKLNGFVDGDAAIARVVTSSGAIVSILDLRSPSMGPTGAAGTSGTNGTNGQGFNFRGGWAPNVAYNAYDVVTNGGQTYETDHSFISGSTFNITNWNVWAQQGAAGAAGPNQVTGSTTTGFNGLLRGNGTNVAVATPGTDYVASQAQSDWNESTSTAVDYIRNKPTIGTAAAHAAADFDAAGTASAVQTLIPPPSSTTPFADGTASYGSSTNYARADHIHPTDTSRQPKIAVTGIAKWDGSGNPSSAVPGTDYAVPSSVVCNSQPSSDSLTANGSFATNCPLTASSLKAGQYVKVRTAVDIYLTTAAANAIGFKSGSTILNPTGSGGNETATTHFYAWIDLEGLVESIGTSGTILWKVAVTYQTAANGTTTIYSNGVLQTVDTTSSITLQPTVYAIGSAAGTWTLKLLYVRIDPY